MEIVARKDFPIGLRQIPHPPKQLWLRGALPPADTKLLVVVGSRALTNYGRDACEYLIGGLAGYPISIVSGLAFGADACAHRAALAAGLHTVAIPGSGLGNDVLYPRSHTALAKEILAKGGALLSEHPPDHAARPYDFPSRNRIMVGLADAVLLIEAGERSGSLITARLAADYNRDLLCIPHRIQDRNSTGVHQFLRLGATLVTESMHVLEALGLAEIGTRSTQQALPSLSIAEQRLYSLLEESRSRDELIRDSGLSVHDTLVALSTLELNGVITRSFGGWRRV